MQVRQNTFHEEVYAGFRYIFGGLQHAYLTYRAEPPVFPFGGPRGGPSGGSTHGGAGTSGTRHDDDDDDDDADQLARPSDADLDVYFSFPLIQYCT